MTARFPHNMRMPMTDTRKALLQIHFCVLLWGVTAILGKLITLPALPLVWWRMLLVVAMLALLAGLLAGIVPAHEAFSGFGDDIIVIVAAALLVSAAVARSGAVETAMSAPALALALALAPAASGLT